MNAPFLNVYGNPTTTTLSGTTVYPNAAYMSPPDLDSTGPALTDCTSTPTAPYSNPLNAGLGVICFTAKNVDISGMTLENGTFVFENGVTAGNTGGTTNVINGTIDVYGGSFNQNTNSNLNIWAPTSGAENGVGLLVPATNLTYPATPCLTQQSGNPKNNVLQVQFGSNNQTIDGYIVAPNSMLYLQDNGGGVTYSGIDVGCLYAKTSTINMSSYDLHNPTTTPNRVVSLVE